MNWRIEFTRRAVKELRALDPKVRARIKAAIEHKLLDDPKPHLIPLQGDRREYFKFRVGAWRLLCKREDDVLLILVVRVAHRGEVYRR